MAYGRGAGWPDGVGGSGVGEMILQCRGIAGHSVGDARRAVNVASRYSEYQEDDTLRSDLCPAVSIAVAECLSLLFNECVLEWVKYR